ncbi:MAG TPA: 50S ribosomal protein L22 [Acidimicrobiia bacterium]|nr:50S ribosomal protein L22 [Acidimicrobiia bacterium]
MAVTLDTPSSRATVRYLSVSPYKIRQVLQLVRGLPVDDAIRVLQLCEKDAADNVLKLLDSAIANAEHNQQLPADELYIARVWCDEGPTRKSGQARARGRYFRVRKRTSHLTIVLARYEPEELEARRRREESSGRGAATAQRRRSERVRRSRQREQAADHDHDHEHTEAEPVEEPVVEDAVVEDAAVDQAADAPVAETDVDEAGEE